MKKQQNYLPTVTSILGVLTVLIIGSIIFMATRPHRTQPGMRSVADTVENIHYCNDKNPVRTLDFLRPKDTGAKALPLVVYIHGGGWRGGSQNGRLINNYGKQFLQKGIAVATIGYRTNSSSPFPDQNQDIACALEYLDDHADTLHINPRKVVYFGDSAGGQLAAFAALNIPYAGRDYEAPVGVIDFYGVSDFSKIVDGAHPDLNARRYLGSRYNKLAREASPTSYITKKAPRFLFVHGTRDTVVPISQSLLFYDQLTTTGIDAEYLAVDGAKHAFNGPELPPETYKKITTIVSSFLKETIQK